MTTKITIIFCLLLPAFTVRAQNQIITPVGKPLVIGHQGGVKFSHLNAATPTQASNGKVLSVDDNGVIMLVPESTGTPSQWTSSGSSLYYNLGNVGLGTDTPLQRLDVNGDINLPSSNGIRFNNVTMLRAPGTNNLFLGPNVGAANTTGFRNVFVGSEAGMANTIGYDNLFIGGRRSGRDNTTGYENVFFGTSTGVSNTTGFRNAFLGPLAGFYNTTGSENTFVGWGAAISNTTGSNNVYVGRAAGTGVSTGTSNTFVGSNSASSVSSTSYSTAVGEGSKVDCDYCLVLGRTSPQQVKVGIGTATPQTTLHVVSGGTTATGVRLENLPTASGTFYRLYVDADGNLMRRSTSGQRESAEGDEGHWSLTADGHLLNGNAGGVVIGTGLSGTPAGYRLYVSDGILTERVKVAVKSTADWRDNVLRDDYRLRPLEEVDSYIRENKHLPGVPTAEDMVASGNDLHQTDALLLEKIEELTLYVIALKKENRGLRDEAGADRSAYEQTLRALLARVEALEKK